MKLTIRGSFEMGCGPVKFPQFCWKLNIKKDPSVKMLTLGRRWVLPREWGCWVAEVYEKHREGERDTDCCTLTPVIIPKWKKLGWLKHTETCQEILRCRWGKLFPLSSSVYTAMGIKEKIGSIQVSESLPLDLNDISLKNVSMLSC